jgi:hypothetical protein
MPICAAPAIDVLWYSYAHDTSIYKRQISRIAEEAHRFLDGDGPRWNLSWFGPGSVAPDFSAYDVLVIHSAETGKTGSAVSGGRVEPDYSGILGNKIAIETARGSRTFISGSDADLHAVRGDTGHTPIFIPDYGAWDGALGHVVNVINWAASGRGLGIVTWYHGEGGPDAYWWSHASSFLKEELEGYVTDFAKDIPGDGRRENTPIISEEGSRHPVNKGLTTTGLSNWQWSFHGGFDKAIAGYRGVIHSTKYPDLFLAIAREHPPAILLILGAAAATLGLVLVGWMVAHAAIGWRKRAR